MPRLDIEILGTTDKKDKMGMQEEIAGAEQADEQMYEEIAPRGNFSAKAMNNLVKASNRLLPLFEQTGDYPTFTADVEVFPTDFVRVLGMFQGAVNTAVDADVVDGEMDFMMEDIVDDQTINLIAGKLNALAKSKDFRRFLKNPPEEEEATEEEMPQDRTPMPTMEETDKLFSGRM